MKLTIKETLRPMGDDTYITKDPMDIAKKCAKGDWAYRILYDAQTDLYMIGDAWQFIHMQLLKRAFHNGWYDSQRKFIEEFVGYYSKNSSVDYWSRGIELTDIDDEDQLDTSMLSPKVSKDEHNIYPWLYCYGFLPASFPEEDAVEFIRDDYDRTYEYQFGTLFTRDFELNETPDLERALRRVDA